MVLHRLHCKAPRAAAAAGAGVAAATDLTFSLYGYTAVVLNDFLTALYLILVKNSPASSGLTTTGLLFYNAAISLPLLGAAVALSAEPAGILAYPDKHSRGFQVCSRHFGDLTTRVLYLDVTLKKRVGNPRADGATTAAA